MRKREFTLYIQDAKHSLQLALPYIASKIINRSSGFMATLFTARLGQDSLAAIAISLRLYIIVAIFLTGFTDAISVLVSHHYGARQLKGISISSAQGLLLALFLSVPIIILFYYSAPLLKWGHLSSAVINLSIPYLHVLGWCLVPAQILNTYEALLIGLGKTRLVLLISILQVPFEILFIYVFVFGKLGLPACGLQGTAYGYLTIYILSAILISIVFHSSQLGHRYSVFKHLFPFNKKYLLEIIRLGAPMGVMKTLELSAITVLVFMLGYFGSDVLAAHQIAWQYFIVMLGVVFGFSQTTSVRIGHYVGMNKKTAIKRTFQTNMILSVMAACFFALCYLAFSKWMIAIDLNLHDPRNANLIHYAKIFLMISGIGLIFNSVGFIAMGGLRGLKDTRIPLILSVISFWGAGLFLAYYFAFKLHLGGVGVWLGFTAGIIIYAIIMLYRFNHLFKRINLSTLLMHE